MLKHFFIFVSFLPVFGTEFAEENKFANYPVTDLVCPKPGTWINCMPPITSTNSYCSSEVRTWVTENCPDVGYAD